MQSGSTNRWAAFALVGVAATLLAKAGDEAVRDRPAAPSPRLVTLAVKNEPLGEVLLKIAAQTGNRRVHDRRELPLSPVTINIDKLTFWKALDAVATATQTRIDCYHRSGDVVLVSKRATGDAPVSYDGFFRTSIKRITASRELETDTVGYSAQVEVAWEPRLEPILLETRPGKMIVKDERGQELKAVSDGSLLAPVDGKLAIAFDVPLPALPRSAAKIGLLQGKLLAVAPTEMVTLDFGTLASLADAKAGSPERRRAEKGMTCTLTKVDLRSDRTTVQVRIELPKGGPSLESYQSWVVNNEMVLTNKDKVRRLPANFALDNSTARSAVLSYHFSDKDVLTQPGEWTLSYRTPVGLVEIPFGFSFKDVPLP